jgi:Amt family ammonium transporter
VTASPLQNTATTRKTAPTERLKMSNAPNQTDPWTDVNTGDNSWQLTAASFVALQSVPGLVVLYAGIVKTKWAINSAFMAFYAFACVLICWVLWAYKLGFGEQMLPFVGHPGPVVLIHQELEHAWLPAANLAPDFPQATMIYFQFVFAAITVVIMSGAFLCRMNFTACRFPSSPYPYNYMKLTHVAGMIFVPFWLTFSYCIGAFSLWGGGFLFQMGVIDYSGGYVIHLSSGTAGFVGAAIIGPRHPKDRLDAAPNNLIFVLLGAGLLWIGWNGFNGGDPYAASADAGVAVLNTNICTAMSLLCWTICDMIYYKKPSVLGAVQGMITGLVAITPAAGVVAGWGAIAMGFASGTIPWVSMNIVGKKVPFIRNIDDTLGVVHTHMVAGFLGGFCTGLFATVEGCAAFGLTNPGGAIAGNGKQVWLQIVGALFIIGWNTVWTAIILLCIKLIVPLRMSEEQLLVGDDAIHGEAAYVFGEGVQMSMLHGDYGRNQTNGDGELGVTMGQSVEGHQDGEHVLTKGEPGPSREIKDN